MKTILEAPKQTEVLFAADVLVCGGGIAGLAAAIAAARGGKRVLLAEREFGLGGMATLGLITIYLPLDDGEGNQVVFGLGEELLRLSVRHGAEVEIPDAWKNGGTAAERIKHRYIARFNPHLFALEAERLLLSLGVRILYGTLVCGAVKDGGRLKAVLCENKSGRFAIEAESFIDCSGDADLCALAGAKTALHANGNGLASWYYYFSGNEIKLKMFGLADVVPDEDGKDAAKRDDGSAYENVKVESIGALRFSGVDGEELSRAVAEAHTKMLEDILEQKAVEPAFLPVNISQIPLVRMSRRLIGAYTMDDSESRVFMDDSIGMTGDWRKRGPAYELPFRILHGEDVPNLLAAGRCVSVTDAMWDITRVIPPCAVTGEAAGTAAALTSDFPRLEVKKLQDRLTSRNQKIHL
jgi:hypothetical protein